MLNRDGVPTLEQVKSIFPNEEILIRSKVIIECYENIPCNPCSTSCPFDAISIGKDINQRPQVNYDLCTGCGICVFSCPGLAIMNVKIRENDLLFKVPYEFVPYPVAGETMHAINRSGEIICDREIEKITVTKKQDKTALLSVKIPKEYLYEFITVRRIT